MPFLSLPAEVCVQVYRHILHAITLQGPISDTSHLFRAIVLASKQICSEFEFEAFKHSKELQSKLKKQWHLGRLLVAPPCCVRHCFEITASISLAALSLDAHKQISHSTVLFNLISAHFLTYTVYHCMDSTNTAKQVDNVLLPSNSRDVCTTTYARGVSTTTPSHTSV
ncbi:hypothetical protein HBI56_030800 [Parastagonospora nodorum]|nr:hypothetical protein HBI09_104250 [Parastagonospora nodorum]KAH4910647.1 hypothetical protein HBI80_027720 [Parastagonospora nodorum]KAH4921462.1 hypothetical protein HBH74_125850 [Parastagonospora nodorum]KAH4929756.1 hypothetical protein HBH73_193210 [Parastagonospora nodorum]KAH5010359.1 hypothetical protein HBI77_088820 [Parastagonospora nodorum]